jgi:vitamin B12 transporter
MRQQGSRWIIRLTAASCLGTALFSAPRIEAAELVQMAMAAPTDEDLLMFWDEKELYVQTATRSEKPISMVAENMTVITAKEIEVMNATSINEVLSRVPGLFAKFQSNDYNSSSFLQIQGSENRHVSVLLDGMPINFTSEGNAETSFIPLQIVERIEIIKGAASSAWGSGLGGVVNIITRSTGDNATPNGMFGVSWGKGNSRNGEAELRGKNGPLGYYLYAGQLGSEGLRNSRDSSRSSLFGKLLLTPTRDLDVTISGGYSNPRLNSGDLGGGSAANVQSRNRFLNGSVEYRATPELTVRGGVHIYSAFIDVPVHTPSDSSTDVQTITDEQTIGGNLRATWSSGIQTLTVGAEASHGSVTETVNTGSSFQAPGLYCSFGFCRPATFNVSPTIDRWGIFANDTIEFGQLAVTPGIRLDHDSVSGYFVSPSLGATYELGEHTVARASVARGFTSPPLTFSQGQGFSFRSNPDIKSEYGWSYQAGLESGLADLVNLKGTLFRHETSNAISLESVPASTYRTVYNRGTVIRQGYELEGDTIPYYNFSFRLGHAYAHYNGDSVLDGYSKSSYDTYSWLAGVKYDDRNSFTALLSGRYTWWDLASTMPDSPDPMYGTFIWDLTATKKFQLDEQNKLETFLTVHNIFSGNYYIDSRYPNPGRWVEGGVKFRF